MKAFFGSTVALEDGFFNSTHDTIFLVLKVRGGQVESVVRGEGLGG